MLRTLAALLILCTSAIPAPVPLPRSTPPFPVGVFALDVGTVTLSDRGTFARRYPWGIEYVGTYRRTADGIEAAVTHHVYTWEDGTSVYPVDVVISYRLRYDRHSRCWHFDGSRLTPLP